MKKVFFAVVAVFLFSCSVNHSPNPVTPQSSGSADVTINVGAVGALAKAANIALAKLYITLSAPGQTAISDSFALSGTASTTINKTYANLASLVMWTLTAQSIDSRDSIIHSGFTTFAVQPNQTANVSLSLSAKYSMLKANFFPIRDSVTRCDLLVAGAVKKDSSFAKQSLLGDTVKLSYDYLQTGVAQHITLNVYGTMWGIDTLLYTGDTLITAVAGVNANYNLTLRWVGPALPPAGQATMTVVLGAVGTEIVNGEFANGLDNVRMVAAGENYSLIVKTDGSLWACGYNANGQLGNGNTINQSRPVQILTTGVQSVAAGYYHTLILKTNGSLWGCGSNGYGQLGTGDTNVHLTPIQIIGGGVQSVAAGWNFTLILKTDGSLWTCGYNGNGEFGNGTQTDQHAPVQVLSSGVQRIAAGEGHTLIVKTDGSLWACGSNSYGQLGNGSTNASNIPIQILSSGVQNASARYNHSLIAKTDGSLWACGSNSYGQLGNGSTNASNIPIQILSSGVQSVSAGYLYTLIVKSDGSLWACGNNGFGQLGNGTTTDQHTPVQILNGGVQSVASGGYHTLVVKTDGSLWACGDNGNGQFGDGTTVDRLVPTLINLP